MADDKELTVRETVIAEFSPQQVVEQLEKVQELMRLAMKKDVDYGVIPGTRKPSLLKPGAEKLLLMFRLDPEYEATCEVMDGVTRVISTCVLWSSTTGVRRGSGMGACDTTERGREHVPVNTILKMANKRALVAAILNVTGASQIFTQDAEDSRKGHDPVKDAVREVVSRARAVLGVENGDKWLREHYDSKNMTIEKCKEALAKLRDEYDFQQETIKQAERAVGEEG